MNLRALVLAGGAGQRYGGNKLLSDHPDGGSLLGHVVRAISPLVADTLVVTGRWHDALAPELARLPVIHVFNPDWQQGIGRSIACGIQQIRISWPDTTHILICVGDVPAISTASLSVLQEAAEKHPGTIIASAADDFIGAPAVFPTRFYSALSQLSGERGAIALIHEQLNNTPPGCVAVSHPEAAWDIDRPSDWHRNAQKITS